MEHPQPLRYGNILHGSSEAVVRNLKRDAESAYPLIHEAVYSTLCDFLDCKHQYGELGAPEEGPK